MRVGHDDVGVVAVLASGHGDVEQLPACLIRVNERVRGVDAGSLGSMDGAGVAEFEFFVDILRGQHERLAARLVALAEAT